MPLIPFGEYLPDLPTAGNPGLTVAKNVIPEGSGYREFPSSTVVSDALAARAQGYAVHENTTGLFFSYAGDATELYMMSNLAWATAGSGAYNLTATDGWEFAHYGSHIYAVNINDEPVRDVVGTGTFATYLTSTLKPKAHHIAVVGDFIVLGDINDGAIKRTDVIWSALGDPLDFDASAATQAGQQTLRGEQSQVNHIFGGGRSGIIFQKESIWKMTFEGPRTIFRFDQISENIGMIAKRGGCKSGDDIFFLSDSGFYLMRASTNELRPIGKNRVDRTVLESLDKTALDRCSCVIDSNSGLYYFGYPTGSASNRIAIYNPFQDRWALAEVDHQLLVSYVGGGAAGDIDSAPLSTRDIDADPYNIDAVEFKGGQGSIGSFDTSNRLSTFNGTGMDATLETGEAALMEGRRPYINRVRPIVEGGSAITTISAATRETLTGTSSFGNAVSLNTEGEAPIRASGRYMKFRTSITGGFDDATGIELEPKARGRK
jgi:hypothetical protein